jgi:hypothetical protein
MPSTIYPVPAFHQQRASRSPSLGQRLRTWWRRDRLDEQLAQGDDREASAELMLRAARLVSSSGCVELAKAVERVVFAGVKPSAHGANDPLALPSACATSGRSTFGARR